MISRIEHVPLNSVCEIGNGYAFKSEEFLTSGTPLLRISNIVNERISFDGNTVYLDESKLSKHESFVVKNEDVLIALSGATTGKYGIYLSEEPCLLNQRIGIIRSGKSEKLDSKYFYFYLSILQSKIFSEAQGAAQPNISAKDIGSMEIPLPPLAEQQKIAAILDAADSLRQKDQQLVERYTALSQSLFLEMFGDPVSNPMGWDIKVFSEVAHNLDSKRVPVKESDRNQMPGSFPYYGATGIVDYINDFIFDGQHLLIAEDGKNLVNRKKPIAWIASGKFWVNNHAHILKFNGYSNLWFLQYILNTMDISNYVTGIDQFKMNKSNLNRIPVISPPITLQNQFAERIQLIEAQKQQAQRSLERSEALFSSLLQRAFTGELTAKMAA